VKAVGQEVIKRQVQEKLARNAAREDEDKQVALAPL